MSTVTAVLFTVSAFVTTQVDSVRAVSPWQDDPYDSVVSFSEFLVPTLVVLLVARMCLGLSGRIWQLLRSVLLATLLVALTVAADAMAVLAGADRVHWTAGTQWLGYGLVALAALAVVSFFLQRLAFRGAEPDGDWLGDAVTVLAWLRIPAAGAAGFVRRHFTFSALLVAAAASLVVTGALAVGEGGLDPLLFAVAVLTYAAGLFAFCMMANGVLRIVPRPARLGRTVVGFAALGAPAAFALRDAGWVLMGHDSEVRTAAQLAGIVAVGAASGAVVGFLGWCVRGWRIKRRWVRVVTAVALTPVLLIASYVAAVTVARAQPSALPAPTGFFTVGRKLLDWTDGSRVDPLAPVPGTRRELSVWLWYPAARATGAAGPYAPGLWSQLHFPVLGPGLFEGSFGLLQGHSYDGAPAAGGKFPLVVLEPGMGLSAAYFTTIAENLASHGYLVAGITPTYSANLTVIGGRTVTSTTAGNPDDPDAVQGTRLVDLWAADARFVAAKLGGGRVVYIGHSFGGAASLQACHLDARCGGAVDLDGAQFGSVVKGGVQAPMMILGSANSCVTGFCQPANGQESEQRTIARSLLTASTGPTWRYSISGTQHFNFTDYAAFYLAPPVNTLIPLGPIDGDRGLTIVNAYVVAFTDHVVRGTAEPLLTGPSARYPEVLPSGR
ncbi:hypothetical protein [Fodinicola feengrottensis]|uniref:hypothetical protein n=1 Tax=Fodinicola feengrottensis TaxID=435914 RepID=UPI0031E13EB8